MLPFIQIGPLSMQTPGLVLILGLWLALNAAERQAPRYGLQASQVYNLAFAALVVGVIGARLAYVANYPAAFAASPLGVLSLNPGLLDPWAGAAAGVIAALVYGQRKGLPFWPTLDALTPGLGIMLVALALANLASGAAFGAPTSLPWGIELWGARRHPSQVYAALAAGLALWAVWPGKGLLREPAPGVRFMSLVALSAAARLFLEAFRGDSLLLPGGLRQAQVLAWVVLAAALVGIGWLARRGENKRADSSADFAD